MCGGLPLSGGFIEQGMASFQLVITLDADGARRGGPIAHAHRAIGTHSVAQSAAPTSCQLPSNCRSEYLPCSGLSNLVREMVVFGYSSGDSPAGSGAGWQRVSIDIEVVA